MGQLLLGILLTMLALACAAYVLFGPARSPVSRERITGTAVVSEKSALTSMTNAVVTQVDRTMSSRGWVPFTAHELELAGIKMTSASLVVMICSIAVVAAVLGEVVGNPLLAVVLAVAVPVGAKLVLKRRASKRRSAFANQLHETLQMMAAAMRAGHSLPRALDAVSRESQSPMSEELARVVNENRLGRDLVEALNQTSARMQSEDFKWVAGAIRSQRETGGNLNEVLDRVAETILERNHIRQQVKSLSAEGVLSAYILMALPVGVGGFYFIANPGVMMPFVASGIGKLLLLGSAVLYVLGGMWMRSIVRIEF